jgi:predicted transglutaminase-like cysteine proteinase
MGCQMKWAHHIGAIFFGVGLSVLAANAQNVNALEASWFTPIYGKAQPPVGYVNFCTRHEEDCQSSDGQAVRLALTPDRWNLIYQVNTYVNNKITPVSDRDLYGEAEHWDYPVDAGDCEDYLLLKRKYLLGLGFPPESLLITVVLDEKNEGHAVLTVTSETGDYILDNRRDDVRRASDTNYRFLKRQTPENPREWVALFKQKPARTTPVIASNSASATR